MANKEKTTRGECCDCGFKVHNENFRAFDFDHRNPQEKIASISDMCKNSADIQKIIEEIKKCDLRCANCHFIKSVKFGENRRPKQESNIPLLPLKREDDEIIAKVV